MLNTIFKAVVDFVRDRYKMHEESVELAKSVQGRFLSLFEEHGIHKNQIPSFFGHGITLQDVESPEKLLGCLNDEILNDASKLFGVSLDWLQGADDTIFPIHSFYKRVQQFSEFVAAIKSDSDFLMARLYLSTDSKWERDSVLVLSKQIGTTGTREIFRHYLCADWVHKYGKARADLVACTAILIKQGVVPRISWVKKPLTDAAAGLIFPSAIDEMKTDPSVFSIVSRFFGAEKWVTSLNDFEFLVDDSEYEKASAISGWLEHYRNGFMDIGGNQNMDGVVGEFRARLKQIEGSKPVQ